MVCILDNTFLASMIKTEQRYLYVREFLEICYNMLLTPAVNTQSDKAIASVVNMYKNKLSFFVHYEQLLF